MKRQNSLLYPLNPLPLPRRSVSAAAKLDNRAQAPLCVVCLSQCSVQIKNVCPKKCEGANMCLTCAHKLWSSWLNDSRYVVAPPKCFGCKSIVTPSIWRSCVKPAEFEKYLANLESQFIVRCPYCDTNTSFFYRAEAFADDIKMAKLDEIAANFTEGDISTLQTAFYDDIESFKRYEKDAAVKLVDTLIAGLDEETARCMLVPSVF